MSRTANLTILLLSLFCFLAVGCDTMAANDGTETEPPPEQLPEQLRLTVTTDDQADQIEVTTEPLSGLAGRIQVCLAVETESGWWKGIGLNESAPTIEGERSEGRKCTTINPGRIDIAYWKAKVFGVHTPVGTRDLDLSQYRDHEVTFTWKKD